MSLESLRNLRNELLALAPKHEVRNVRVFGSIVRRDNRVDSDVDLLVDVEPDRPLLDIAALEHDLEQSLGASIEVLTERGLSAYLERQIVAEAGAL